MKINHARILLLLYAGIIAGCIIISPKMVQASDSGMNDTDADGLIDSDEQIVYHTDPTRSDTDGDGYLDGQEVASGYSPRSERKARLEATDSDHDGLNDAEEIAVYHTDLLKPDTDGDGYSDGKEVLSGYDPLAKEPRRVAKRIEVNLTEQHLRYFFGAAKVADFAISSGLPGTPTPVGTFTVLKKRPLVNYAGPGYSFPNTKWNLMFKHGVSLNYYIHGAYWQNDFGRPKSHGCVNVPPDYGHMGKLYDWAQVGTPVMITK